MAPPLVCIGDRNPGRFRHPQSLLSEDINERENSLALLLSIYIPASVRPVGITNSIRRAIRKKKHWAQKRCFLSRRHRVQPPIHIISGTHRESPRHGLPDAHFHICLVSREIELTDTGWRGDYGRHKSFSR